MEKDFFDRTTEASQALPETISREVLRKKFQELVDIMLAATVVVVKNRNAFQEVLRGYQKRVHNKESIASIEQWEAAVEVYVFIYTTLRDVAYGRRDRSFLTNLHIVLKEQLTLLSQEYLTHVEPSKKLWAQIKIEQRMADIDMMQQSSLVALRRFRPQRNKPVKISED